MCTTELHMLYYYTVDVPTYTYPDMIISVTRNTDFRLCCIRHARQIKVVVLYWKLWSDLETPLFQTAWTGTNLNLSLATDPTLSQGENSVLRVRECAVHYAIKASLVKLKNKEKRNLLLYFVGAERVHILCVS